MRFAPLPFYEMGKGEPVAQDIAAQILAALEDASGEHGVDIVDVELSGSDGRPIVRVRIDNADEASGPITLDEIAAHNSWVEAILDEIDPIAGAYTFELSSPGLARPLRRAKDFVRFAGEQVSLSTSAQEGRRRFTGELVGYEDDAVVLLVDGERMSFSLDEIKACKIKPNIDFSGQSKKN